MMKKINKILAVILVFVMSVSVVSCVSEQSVADDTSEPVATDIIAGDAVVHEPVSGGVMKLSSLKYNSLNPLTTDCKDIRQYMSLVYSELIALDYSGKPTAELAESWESTDGYVTWSLKLRKNVNWHDGGTVDAADVVATVNHIKTKGGNYAANVKKIKTVEAVDELTVRMVCTEACPMLPCMLNFPVLKLENINTAGTMPVGSGMYLYDYSRSTPDKVVLKKFDGYYGNKPYIDYVEISFFATESEKYKSDCDFAVVYDGVSKASYAKENIHTYDFAGNLMTLLYFNLNGSGNYALVKDSAVRNAISCYMDRENLIKAGASGNAEPAILPCLRGNFLFAGDDATKGLSSKNGDEFMQSAGYTKNASGMWSKNGTVIDISLLVPTGNTEFMLLAERIEKNLEKNGVSVTLKYGATQEYANAVKNGTYSVAAMQVTLGEWLDLESFYKKGAKFNLNSFSDAGADALMTAAKTADSYEGIRRIYAELIDLLSDGLPVCGIYIKNQTAVVSDSLYGISDSGLYSWDVFASVDKWYVE